MNLEKSFVVRYKLAGKKAETDLDGFSREDVRRVFASIEPKATILAVREA